MNKIHPTAVIHGDPEIGINVEIGAFSEIHGNVKIGSNSKIESHCVIGYPTPLAHGKCLKIGANSLIRTHSVFYEGSTFGEGLRTGHHVTVRELTEAGDSFQIGTLTDIQGHCEIGHHVRFHSNVHIGQKSKIGSFVWVFPYVVLTNDPHPPSEVFQGVTVEDYAVIATMSTVLPGVTVAKHAVVGAHSLVNRDVREKMVVVGVPAKEIMEASKIKHRKLVGSFAYPWPRHFHRGYPEDVVKKWIEEYT